MTWVEMCKEQGGPGGRHLLDSRQSPLRMSGLPASRQQPPEQLSLKAEKRSTFISWAPKWASWSSTYL